MKRLFTLILLSSFFFLLSACGLGNDGTAQTAATPIPPTPTALPLDEETETAVDDPLVPEAEETVRKVIIWLPPAFADKMNIGQDAVGTVDIFQQQLRVFEESRSDIEIIVEQKEIDGNGGIFDYLRTGRSVAPAILPHLIVLPTEYLSIAAEAGYLQPLSPHLPAGGMAALYPAAQRLAQVDGEVMGYPIFLTHFTHMVSKDGIFIENLEPIRWRSMISKENVQFAFPAAGEDGTLLLLQMYLAEGGSVMDKGTPVLELEPLINALAAFENPSQEKVITPDSRMMSSFDEVWPLFLEEEGGVTVIQTDAAHFLQNQASLDGAAFAAMPGSANILTPLLDGWAWALPYSPDEDDLTVVVDLLNFLSEPENLSVWSEACGQLPARRSALAGWESADTPYLQFVDAELLDAEQVPITAQSEMMAVLADALFNVVSLNETAVEAAQTAVSTINN